MVLKGLADELQGLGSPVAGGGSGGVLRVALAQSGGHGLEAVRQRAHILDHIEEELHSTHRPHLPPAPR